MAAKKKVTKRATVRKAPVIFREPELLKLDLGSGPRPAEGFKGVDIVPGQTDYTFDLCSGQRWPWADSSVSEMRSSHFIEHIDACYITTPEGKRLDALYWFFQEAYRVAKDGAVLSLQWPALKSVRAFQDATHRRFLPAEFTTYLSRDGQKAMGVEHYAPDCNWIGSVQPTIAAEPETDKDREMALRADSSDDKQAYYKAKGDEQRRRYLNEWEFSCDFIAILKAHKS